ncbi:MAG: SDR family oxidoreductase [Candidatus Omnitrophota bacterium]|nr:SDR family oxidoreductase [Candidatus Omnitrophota bacterium]
MKKNVAGKMVVITGGSRGIGAAITKAFWEAGDYVLVGARRSNDFLKGFGRRVRFKKIDVRFESEQAALAGTAIKWRGRIDIFVNCAGFSDWRSVDKVDEKFWSTMIDTNLKGVFWGCKVASLCLPKGGCIINISSLAGKRGSANNSVYCASKFGVNGITQSLAKELGPRGIRVNALCPVYVETEALHNALGDELSPSGGKNINVFLKDFAKSNAALRRLPSAEEIAQLCVFLASDKASAITGQCINVDCGVLPQ